MHVTIHLAVMVSDSVCCMYWYTSGYEGAHGGLCISTRGGHKLIRNDQKEVATESCSHTDHQIKCADPRFKSRTEDVRGIYSTQLY
jgi:hypothetical protein